MAAADIVTLYPQISARLGHALRFGRCGASRALLASPHATSWPHHDCDVKYITEVQLLLTTAGLINRGSQRGRFSPDSETIHVSILGPEVDAERIDSGFVRPQESKFRFLSFRIVVPPPEEELRFSVDSVTSILGRFLTENRIRIG